MSDILVIFASVEGQTRRIADAVAERLRSRGHRVAVIDATRPPRSMPVGRYAAVILGGSVHYGRHPRRLLAIARRIARERQQPLLAFFSVSGAAADGSDASRGTARRYADSFLTAAGLSVDEMALFAGAVRFTLYGPVKRWVMRRIQAGRGGDTDTSRDYEYTDWDAVRGFADDIAERLAGERSEQDVEAQEDRQE
ncbi:MAG TPA: flavodoxin domain-containing protein [Gammaproteobacteria bacterium]|nr:flavodoxin domain-containing protein [Gammaproteobacteria bacterium]